jgi:hypothetical protein
MRYSRVTIKGIRIIAEKEPELGQNQLFSTKLKVNLNRQAQPEIDPLCSLRLQSSSTTIGSADSVIPIPGKELRPGLVTAIPQTKYRRLR